MRITPSLTLDKSLLKAGMRVAVGLSGGADSVALLCALAEQGTALGLVLHAAHLHHGLRGEEADADLEFCRELAAGLGVAFHEARVDTAAEAKRVPVDSGVAGVEGASADSIEGTARRLRYAWFRRLMVDVPLDAVATAHTRNDQAETVLGKFLRGAWTDGLSGIYPVVQFREGLIVRPLLGSNRVEVEAWLRSREQVWREDSTNKELTFTRNRIRHELLPELETWNPQLQQHLAHMAELARGEGEYWREEIERIATQIVVGGRPVRGGGRANTAADGIALDLAKLAAERVSVQRRVLRFAAGELGASPDFAATESLRSLAIAGRGGQRLELAQGLQAERTHREIRLTLGPVKSSGAAQSELTQYECVIPGEVMAPLFRCRIRIEAVDGGLPGEERPKALVRSWKPGDRVRLRYSSGPRKIKEVLERMKVTGADRVHWPVVEVGGRILWMRGVEVEPEAGLRISAEPI